jgi:hypothetical protein
MKIKIFKFSVVLLIIFVGCSKSLLDEQIPNLITAESLFKSLDGFEAALNGLYNQVRQEWSGEPNQGTYGEVSLVATDIITTSNGSSFGYTVEKWGTAVNSDDPYLLLNFTWLYQVVNGANTIIKRSENPEVNWTGNGKAADVNKNRVIGEAKAIRAWAYRHITYTFGDVPLALDESKGSTIRTDWDRTPVSIVREQMRSDLLFAEQYVTVEPSLQGRLTKGAVQTYLAELYLALNKPDSAIIFAERVINEPSYKLITERYGINKTKPGTPFTDMFIDGNSNREEGNTEALWVFQYEKGLSGTGNSSIKRNVTSRYDQKSIKGKLPSSTSVIPFQCTVERGGYGRARLAMTKYAIDLYDIKDDRGSNYAVRKYLILQDAATNSDGVPADKLPSGYVYGDTIKFDWSVDFILPDAAAIRFLWPWCRKFDYADPLNVKGGPIYKDQPYIRAADAYLLKAEAQFKKGDNPGAAATINIIRQRSNASAITGAQVNIDLILDERARELIFEEHRRYTLLRTHKWLERTSLHNPNNGGSKITPRDTVFPIPRKVIDANLTKPMTQNPGY